MRFIWTNDTHLEFCEDPAAFYDDVLYLQPDAIALGGDISNSAHLIHHLEEMAEAWSGLPIYFTLGNHDSYGSSIKKTRAKVAKFIKDKPNLIWLDQGGVHKLTDSAALIGNGLWCDWRAGRWGTSNVWLNDYRLIDELIEHGAPYSFYAVKKIRDKVRTLADKYTAQLMKDFSDAVEQGLKKIYVLTHCPPFIEASWHDGKLQDDNWSPHFVCHTAGEQLKKAANQHKDVDITVLCGHTHGSGEADVLPNLHVINGGAVYRHPAAQMPIILE